MRGIALFPGTQLRPGSHHTCFILRGDRGLLWKAMGRAPMMALFKMALRTGKPTPDSRSSPEEEYQREPRVSCDRRVCPFTMRDSLWFSGGIRLVEIKAECED